MKKSILFIASFALLYGLYQIISGLILTAFYTPNVALMNSTLNNEVAFGNTGTVPLLNLLLIATLAYFFTQMMTATKLKGVYIKK